MATDKDEFTDEDFTDEDREILEKLEKEYGRIYPFKMKKHGLLVFRRPSRKEWKRYLKEKDTSGPNGHLIDVITVEENYCGSLFCYPGRNVFEDILDDSPGMVGIFKIICEGLAHGNSSEVSVLGKDWKKPEAAT